LEIQKGKGGLKDPDLKGMYEPKLEIQRGGRLKPKNPLWGEYGYFLEQHIGPDIF